MKRIDDLQFNGLMLVQDPEKYCFTTDSVLLANFAQVKPKDTVVELCAGTGLISVIVAGKKKPKSIIAVELQKDCCDLLKESVDLNNLKDTIQIINSPIQELDDKINRESIDVVIVNPPYYKKEQARNDNLAIALSTHEIALTIDEVFEQTARLLKFGGKLYMVHHTDRLVELIVKMSQFKLEPKIIQFVQPKPKVNANLVLIEAVKGGKTGVKIKDVLIFRDENGEESLDVKKIYGRL